MTTPLFINSVDGTGKSASHDFTVRFNPPLHLDRNKDYYIALDSLSMSYSWHNVSSDFNNNKLSYTPDSGTTWYPLTLPNGNYSYNELNSYIQREIELNGHTKDGVSIKFVPSMLKVFLTLKDDFQLDLRNGDFRNLIGFEQKIYTDSSYGANLPDITRSVDNVFIHSNVVSDSFVSSIKSDVLYRFSVDNLPLSYPFHMEPKRAIFNKINTSIIKDVRIYVTDELNRPLTLNNVPISLILLVREDIPHCYP